jgi:hypothetical protein
MSDNNEMREAYLRANGIQLLDNQSTELIEHLRTRIKELETECRRLEQTTYG